MNQSNLYKKLENLEVNGKVCLQSSLASYTWLKTGGQADIFFVPNDIKGLKTFLDNLEKNIELFILGAGSNTLIRDSGFNGAVIKLGKSFDYIKVLNDKEFKVGAATNCIKMARYLAKNSVGGLEFFSGIPGSVGGAIKMNAGAYGFETSQFLKKIKVVDRNGNIKEIKSNQYSMDYRETNFPEDYIFLEATFSYKINKNIEENLNKIKQLTAKRKASQPIQEKTSGSTFKNPKNYKAWKLIQESGCSYKVGEAYLSDIHSNFIINKGNATSRDIEELGERIRKKVLEKSGVKLTWEIKIIGRKDGLLK
jgi:UDP-N-acetylmuramate dehydrogenase